MRLPVALFFAMFVMACSSGAADSVTDGNENGLAPGAPEEFCGSSTKSACSSDSECVTAGCSSQWCVSVNDEPLITTCQWRDCYDHKAYSMECGCVNNICGWAKNDTTALMTPLLQPSP